MIYYKTMPSISRSRKISNRRNTIRRKSAKKSRRNMKRSKVNKSKRNNRKRTKRSMRKNMRGGVTQGHWLNPFGMLYHTKHDVLDTILPGNYESHQSTSYLFDCFKKNHKLEEVRTSRVLPGENKPLIDKLNKVYELPSHNLVVINTIGHRWHLELDNKKWRVLSQWPNHHTFTTFSKTKYGQFNEGGWDEFMDDITVMTKPLNILPDMQDSKSAYDKIFGCHPRIYDYEWKYSDFVKSKAHFRRDVNECWVWRIE
jgi:hypothetical protein